MSAGSIAQVTGSGQGLPGTSWALNDFGSVATDVDSILSASSGVYTPQDEGYYLIIAESKFDSTHSNRLDIEQKIQKNSADYAGAVGSDYSRNATNDKSWQRSSMVAYFNGTSDSFRVMDRRDTGAGTPAGAYTWTRIKVVQLSAGDSDSLAYAHYGTPTSAAHAAAGAPDASSVVDGWDVITENDTASIELQAGGTDITLKKTDRPYLVLYGFPTDATGVGRTFRMADLTFGGTRINHSFGHAYQRDAANQYAVPEGMALIAPSSSDDLNARIWLYEDNKATLWGTCNGEAWTLSSAAGRAGIMVVELPADTDFAIFDDATANQTWSGSATTDLNFAATESDAGTNFTRDSATAVSVDAAANVMAYAAYFVERTASSGTRGSNAARWELNGTDLTTETEFGQYIRGEQASDDEKNTALGVTHIFAASASDTLNLEKFDPGTDDGGNDVTSMGGAFFIDLDSLAPTGPQEETTSGTLNGGGSLSPTVATERSTTGAMNGGGSIAGTTSSPSETSVVEFAFADLETPYYLDDVTTYIRGKVSSTDNTWPKWYIDIYEGTTYRASLVPLTIATTAGTHSYGWATTAVEAIGVWSDVRLRIKAYDGGGNPAIDATIYDIWIEAPAASEQPEAAGTINAGGSLSPTVEATRGSTGTINSGGSLAASATKTVELTEAVNAGGSITASVTHLEHASTSGSINSGGSISAAVTATEHASTSGTINGGGSLGPNVATQRESGLGLSSGGSISATVGNHQESASTTGTVNGGGSITATATAAEHAETSGTINGGGSITYAVTSHRVRGGEPAEPIVSAGGSITATVDHGDESASTSGELNGGGSITAAVTNANPRQGIIHGGGSLTATVTAAHASSGTISSGGSITASTSASESATTGGELNAGGSLAASVGTDRTQSGSVRSGGQIQAVAASERTASATIQGGGSLSATVYATEGGETAGELNGGGSITPTVEATHESSDQISGGGSLAASVTNANPRQGIIHGGGSITPTAVGAHNTTGTVNGGGSLSASASGSESSSTSGSINGGGSISPTVTTDRESSGVVSGGGSIAATVTASEAASTSGIVNGGGSIAPTVESTRTSSGTANGGGSLSATVEASEAATTSGTLNSGGSIAATVIPTKEVSGVVSGGGAVTATVSADHDTSGVLNGGGSLTAIASQTADTAAYLGLSAVTDPETHDDHTITLRYYDPAGTGARVDWLLRNGTTTITSGSMITAQTNIQEDVYTLTTGEAALITDYSNLSVRLTATLGNLYVADIRFEVPWPPPIEASGTINSGGSATGTVSGTHIVPAFPSLGEGLPGPIALSGGGSITAVVEQKIPGKTSGVINGGASITAVVAGRKDTSGTLNGGGSIEATTGKDLGVVATINGGGRIIATSEVHISSATINGGGSITAVYELWFDIGTGGGTGPGLTDDGADLGLTDDGADLGLTLDGEAPGSTVDGADIGLTDDGAQPGRTDGLSSPGRTS